MNSKIEQEKGAKEDKHAGKKWKKTHPQPETNHNIHVLIIMKRITIPTSTTNMHIHHFKRYSTCYIHYNKKTPAQNTKPDNTIQK